MQPENLAELLEKDRRALLDLSGRNRLLNSNILGSRTSFLRIHDELSDEVFRQLVRGEERMLFSGIDEVEPDEADVENADAPVAEPSVALIPVDTTTTPSAPDTSKLAIDQTVEALPERYTDDRLQTKMKREPLDKKLLRTYYESRILEEETGVNTLFLVLGYLEYFEDDSSDRPRFAPLLTVPVRLTREDVKARIMVCARDEPIDTNLSLQYLPPPQLELSFEVC